MELLAPGVATVVGTHLNPSQGNTSDGVHRHTLWGEIVYQLGGAAAYREIEQNDYDRIPPGKDDLYRILEPLQPFTILLDEILEYVVSARSVSVGDQSLGSQTLKFFKELTDTVAILKQGLVIATLPSSELEDFGDTHQRNLAQLEKVFGRVETIETPVQGEEVYSIIRRRLFETVEDDAAVREVVDSYVQKYQQHKDELPQKAREADYRRKLELAYPFHPDVIDVLYEKWGTFSSFQRTRGVLRLLANVVEDLYQREKNLDLILPGDINLGRPSIRQEFLRHIGPEYESIIGSDIASGEAKSQALDQANKGWKHLAERIATTIFMHSFAVDSSEKGATLPYVKLAVIRPETIPSLVTEVLQKQANELWYLNTRGDQYYFSRVPNLNRMVLDKKSLVQPPAVREELERRIKRELGTALRSYLWPSPEMLPDNQELKLAVLDPENTPDLHELERWVDRRGDGFRVYKNTLFFALPDRDRYARLADTIREYLALGEIKQEIDRDERPGMQEKRDEVKRRLRDIVEDFPLKVRELYRTAAVPRNGGTLEQIDLGQPAIGRENLDSWYRSELADQTRGKILTRPPSARMLQVKFLSAGDMVSLSAVLEQFYKDPGLPALADPSILAEAIVQGIRDGSFAVGRGSQEEIAPASVRFEEIILPDALSFSEDVFLLTSERAKALKEQLRPEAAPTPGLGAESGGPSVEPPAAGPGPQHPEPGTAPATDDCVEHVTFRASGIPVSKIADLNRGVFQPLVREAGDFTFTIEIAVHSKDGISKKVVDQQVMETLQQLGAKVDQK